MRNLSEIVKQCRELGVLQYREGDFSIVLGDAPEPVETPETSVKPVDKPAETSKPPKRGRDGLTAEEQDELYMRVLPDTQE